MFGVRSKVRSVGTHFHSTFQWLETVGGGEAFILAKREESGVLDILFIGMRQIMVFFSDKSMYKALERRPPCFFFPMKSIWSVSVQPKMCFFVWKATWRMILTVDQLQKEVSLRNKKARRQNHLLHCAKAMFLWELLFSLAGVMHHQKRSARRTKYC